MHVALLGTGLMGLPMATRIVQAGIRLNVWNRTRAKAEPLQARGARVCDSAEDAVRGATHIISMLADGGAVAAVGRQLISAQAIAPGSIWIDMSSTRADEASALAAELNRAGAAFVDAPVSGGVAGAEAGTLAIMAGAEPESFAAAEPLLRTLGRPVRVGPVGAGQMAKLANQAIVGGTIGIVAEAMLMIERAGADPAAFREALKGGFADSTILQMHGRRMSDRDFTPGGKVSTQLKDMDNILTAAAQLGLQLPISESIRERYAVLASNPDRASLDHAALFLELLDRNV